MDQNCEVNTGSVAEKYKLNTEEVFELNQELKFFI